MAQRSETQTKEKKKMIGRTTEKKKKEKSPGNEVKSDSELKLLVSV